LCDSVAQLSSLAAQKKNRPRYIDRYVDEFEHQGGDKCSSINAREWLKQKDGTQASCAVSTNPTYMHKRRLGIGNS
jgi:hypothetical protein